jgi:diaminohydroxyphosphoribosylaminopyrimidine deaminase/5-amino-6-(5-phosphoribosylamino)uracil reductase
MSPEDLMKAALEAAKNTKIFETRPNPQVGCALLLKDGTLVVGAHLRYGENHAEKNAIEVALRRGLDLEGATLAVTLEPCHHFGKTPPCTEFILKHKIGKIFIGTQDPNTQVVGGGAEWLRSKGIEVIGGILEKECQALNQEWLFAHKMGRPFVRIKMATSLDGLWSPENENQERWITGVEARRQGMVLRSRAEVLVTGSNTVLKDRPRFTVRDLETDQEISPPPRVWVFTQKGAPSERVDFFKAWNNIYSKNDSAFRDRTMEMFKTVFLNQKITSILVEAGPKLTKAFLETDLFDEVVLFMNSRFLGGTRGERFFEPFFGGFLPGKPLIITGLKPLSDEDIEIKLSHP